MDVELMEVELKPRFELPLLSVDEEHLVAIIRGREHLHDTDIHDYLLFVRARREVTDMIAREHYPDWPGEEESKA